METQTTLRSWHPEKGLKTGFDFDTPADIPRGALGKVYIIYGVDY